MKFFCWLGLHATKILGINGVFLIHECQDCKKQWKYNFVFDQWE